MENKDNALQVTIRELANLQWKYFPLVNSILRNAHNPRIRR